MLFSAEVYIGVNMAPGKKSIHFAALNPDLETVTLSQGGVQEVLAYLGGQQQAVAALCGPSQPSRGILMDADLREQYLIPMTKGRPGNMRVAEYLLRQHNLNTSATPQDPADATGWMRVSFSLYKQLQKLGYRQYEAASADRQVVEVAPELAFQAWLPGDVLPANTIHGRMQRQLALYDLGLRIPDPMNFFEEVTRFRILQGQLPNDQVYSTAMIAALAAAYLAWQTKHNPEELTQVGVREEGQIMVPAKLLENASSTEKIVF